MSDTATSEREQFQEILNSLDPQSYGMFAEADMGRQAREFAEGDIGRYLLGCARQEYAGAIEKLKRVPFWRYRRIQQLQNEMWRAENFMLWLRDLIIRGRAAEGTLAESEDK